MHLLPRDPPGADNLSLGAAPRMACRPDPRPPQLPGTVAMR